MSGNVSLAQSVPEKLENDLRALLGEKLDQAGAYDVVIHPDSDHDGDAIIVVEVKHRLVDRPIEFAEVMAADRAARDLAWQEGESRFLHVRHIYDEKQQVARAK